MPLARNLSISLAFAAAIACTTPIPPSVDDFDGMIPLNVELGFLGRNATQQQKDFFIFSFAVIDPLSVSKQSFVKMQKLGTETVKVRLRVDAKGRVLQAAYVEGSNVLWVEWMGAFRRLTFNINNDKAVPGPWDLDIEMTMDCPNRDVEPKYSWRSISYRTAAGN